MATAEIDELSAQSDTRREPEINKLFRTVMKHEASDLHLKVGLPAMMRLKGVIRRMDSPPISEEHMEKLIFPIMTPTLAKDLGRNWRGRLRPRRRRMTSSRFRVNVLKQRGHLGWSPAASTTTCRRSRNSACRRRSNNSATSTRA